MNNDHDNSGNDAASVASYSGVIVSSSRSVRSVAKSGWSGIKIYHTQLKGEISEDVDGDGVILLDNGSTMSLFKD